MLMPKRTKYRRPHIVRYEGLSKGGNEVSFGDFGLQALEGAWITDKQIEAARVCISRYTRRGGKVWIRIFPDVPVSDKPAEVRMGKGKGAIEFWVARVKPGRIMFEIGGVPEEVARKAFALGAAKLPVKSKFVKRLNSDAIEGEA